ncbi:hypothetical protein F3N42_14120 [Marinihelvus fidelis]|uniref:IPTL-CTERM sorting domain-containing protein n=1 Tax=Marinihelvus fidelis TaxID=2613842 RepID=A0A5N0T3Z0_9GAMM|nr:hypothetical protein [Marinihelvus fidelis]KAA9129785.1 hypothetical protein F3N42_14120 [Marinihelvus fidelis]
MNRFHRTLLSGLIALPLGSAVAAPFGYSVNSDDPTDGDHLYQIDLANGTETDIGPVQSLGTTRTDIEGLAIAPDGRLWALDDESSMLFPIHTATGQVYFAEEVSLSGFGASAGNDFGMTFTCDGGLYVVTVADQSLYRLELDGTATLVGPLGARISALAALNQGDDLRLFGLGNGLMNDGDDPDNRSLYEIDPDTGAATLIGNVGAGVADYFQAGLSFDENGELWAITDRRTADAEPGSQVLRLDINTGAGTVISTTTQTGYESLAVAPPVVCPTTTPIPEPPPPPPPGGSLNIESIPTLDAWGRAIGTIGLLLLGLAAIRRRY